MVSITDGPSVLRIEVWIKPLQELVLLFIKTVTNSYV